MPTVFLSYSRADLPLIEQLEAQLKRHPDISIWRDQEKIYGGQKWPKVLGEGIADQDVFLLAWSKNSAASHFVELEWNTAIALKKTIVPCLLDNTVLAPILSALHGHRLDDVSGLIKTLAAAPLADAQRRNPVIERLSEIVETEEGAVLKQAKTIFTVQQWIVQGDFYQVAGDFHYHAASKLREPVLRGRVFFIGDNDELMAAEEITVTLLQTAAKTFSDSDGLFTLPLPDTFQPGTKVDVGIKKDEWVIYSPIDGEITIPAVDSELVRIRLVKKGSLKLWSAARIEKFIHEMASKAKEQVYPEGKPQEIDFSRYIKEWAVKYGFSAQQAKAEIDKWVVEAEQGDDPYELGLAAYAKKHFGEAGKLLEESAAGKVRKAREASATAQQFTEEAIRDFRLAGNAHTNNYRFDLALLAYQKARELTSQGDNPRLWVDLTVLVGMTEREIGIRTEERNIHHHLQNAVAAYHAALTVGTKEQLPQDWARTQNNLGAVLRDQGIRTGGEAGTQLLAQAVKAFCAALTVRTNASLPQDWARTKIGLGTVLRDQGIRAAGAESLRLLRAAEKAYREALTVYTKTKASLPQDWAKTQMDLGNVLSDQGIRAAGAGSLRLLRAAEKAYREALTVRTKASLTSLSQDWAMTQMNLGNVLREQGIRAAGAESLRLLRVAEKAYREALTVYTKAKASLPQDWARTQMNLGNVLRDQGIRAAGAESLRLLRVAEKAYREALTVYTEAQLPQDWARTQMNLGTVLSDQGIRAPGTDSTHLLQAAEAVYRDALTVYTKDQFPQDWIDTSGNLTEALFLSSQFAKTRDHLAMLLDYPDLGPSKGVALLAIGIANSVALGTVERTQTEFEKTSSLLSRQGSDFFLTWDFSSIKTFIEKSSVFGKHRHWLLQLIDKFQNSRRDEMQSAIQTARDAFRKASKP